MCEISDADRSEVPGFVQRTVSMDAALRPTTTRPTCVTLEFAGMGIGLLDARPRDLLYAVFQDFAAEYVETPTENRFSLMLRRMEIDNQNMDTEYPVLLEPQRLLSMDGTMREGLGGTSRRDRVVEFSVSVTSPGASPSSAGVHYVKYCILKVWLFDAMALIGD